MWPSARCIKLRIGIYLLRTNFLSIKRRHAPYRLVLINLTADSHLRRRRSRICNHKQRAIRSSENQTDRIRRKIPLSLTTPYRISVLRLRIVAYDPLKNFQSRRRKTVLEGPENWHVMGCFFRSYSRL